MPASAKLRGLGVELAVAFPDVVIERDGVAGARGQFLCRPVIQKDAGASVPAGKNASSAVTSEYGISRAPTRMVLAR